MANQTSTAHGREFTGTILASSGPKAAVQRGAFGFSDPNPDTWVRAAWLDNPALLSERQPGDLNKIEWQIIRWHVLDGMSFIQMTERIGEEPARLRMFAEDATRRAIPERAIQAQAREVGDADTSGAMAREALIQEVRRLYVAVGSPLGNAPEDMYRFFGALAENAAAVDAIRDIIAVNPVAVETVPVVPATVPAPQTDDKSTT